MLIYISQLIRFLPMKTKGTTWPKTQRFVKKQILHIVETAKGRRFVTHDGRNSFNFLSKGLRVDNFILPLFFR